MTSLNAVTSSFDIGAPWTPSLTGSLDEVAVFNRALTDGTGGTVNQIAALYGSSSTGIGNPMSLSPAPVAYYPLGDQDAFNGSSYLTPNVSLKDYVFDFIPTDKIDITGTSLNQPTGDFTFSIWYNMDINSSLMGLYNCSTSNSNGIKILYSNSTNQFTFYHGGLSNTVSWTAGSVNTWNNIVITYDNTSGLKTAYHNGTSVDTETAIVSTNYVTDWQLGTYRQYSSPIGFDGKLSNFQVFNSALPATGSNSVETLYNNGSHLLQCQDLLLCKVVEIRCFSYL